jgi:hypothetical protein
MSIKNIYDTVVYHPTTEEPPLLKDFVLLLNDGPVP